MNSRSHLRLLVASAAILVACDQTAPQTQDAGADMGPDSTVVHHGCYANWIRQHEEPPYTSLIHVVDGALVLEPSAMGVEVQTPLGDLGGAEGIVLRFDFSRFELGPGGAFRLTWRFHNGDIAYLDVTDAGAHARITETFGGLEYDLRFEYPPSRAVMEFEHPGPGQGVVRAYFYGAGGNQVLTAPFAGLDFGSVTPKLELSGLSARAAIDRYSTYGFPDDETYADDFDCDSVATPIDLGWPTTGTVELGSACTADTECGAVDRCVDGACRRPCLTSNICEGEVCLAHPDGGGYCRLPSERPCSETTPCPDGLVCGVDGTCRRPCEGGRIAYSSDVSDLAGTCDLNFKTCAFGDTCTEVSTYRCVNGACADDDELGAREAGGWGCGYGRQMCGATGSTWSVVQCNMTGPGFQPVETCGSASDTCAYVCPDESGAEYRCPTGTTSTMPRCTGCQRSCERGEDVIQYCGSELGTVAVDCETGFSWCSFGPGGDPARMHPGDLPYFEAVCEPVVAPVTAPARVTITPSGGSSVAPFEIDATEVSRAQYVAFLQSRPTLSGAPPQCAWNSTLLPAIYPTVGDWPWFDRPDRPAMVDWCDAFMYCQWAGGHLCGEHGGGNLESVNIGVPEHDTWNFVCTSGGTRANPYGDTLDESACAHPAFPYSDIGTSPMCTSDVAGFTGVYDMTGNAPEWIDSCTPAGSGTGDLDTCTLMTSWPCSSTGAATRSYASGAIRCCYD